MNRPSKKHHFVPQEQLRHFAADLDRRFIYVFDKQTDKSFGTSILNAGSENDFNTVTVDDVKWNFEDLFSDVDGRSARLVSDIVDQRSVSWMQSEDRLALVDFVATQMLRTHFGRTTPRHLAERMRKMVQEMGFDPDDDPTMAMPSDASLRLGAVRVFLKRQEHAQSLLRLVPALFKSGIGRRFVISDHPVIRSNVFSYGDDGLSSHGILMVVPIAPDLAVVLVCPTIISRYEAIENVKLDPEQKSRMLRYRDGFRSGDPIEILPAEVDGYNHRQIGRSARFLYSATDDFAFAREYLSEHAEMRQVETHVHIGEMGRGPPRRSGMPPGLQIVVNGQYDICMLSIIEIDETGEGITAKTSDLGLLKLVAEDRGMLRIELYDDGQSRRGMEQAIVERFGKDEDGWFRAVHRDEPLRSFARHLDSE